MNIIEQIQLAINSALGNLSHAGSSGVSWILAAFRLL